MKSKRSKNLHPDTKLTYWDNWKICGPDGSIIVYFRESPPSFDKKRLSDNDYLIDRINNYPEATLLREDVWYTIIMLRQKSQKDKDAVVSLRKICKAILGDGRIRKDQNYLTDLKIVIFDDIKFFRIILEQKLINGITVEKAIEKYITSTAITESHRHKRLKEMRNYQNIYFAYKAIYDELLKNELTVTEAFTFFEKAADNINRANVTITVEPDNRLLIFVKMKSWYVKGSDMCIERAEP